MVGLGMVELLMLLVLTPAAPYGRPADSATVFRHVPDAAVLVVSADLASMVHGGEREFDKVLGSPLFKKSVVMQQAATMLREGRAMVEGQVRKVGLKDLKDIRYVTAAMGFSPEGERALVAFGGKIPDEAVAALAGLMEAKKEGDHYVLAGVHGRPDMLIARAKDGAVVLGSRPWIETAVLGGHSHKSLAPLLRAHDRRTYFMMAFRPDQNIKDEWKKDMGPLFQPLFVDGLFGVAIRMTYRGSELRVVARDARFAEIWGGVLRGLGLASTAGRDAAEGLLTMGEAFLSSLESVPRPEGASAEEREILRVLVTHRKEIHKLLIDHFLGKRQKASVRVNKGRKDATLTITGKGLAAMMFLPAGVGYFMLVPGEAKVDSTPVPVEPAPAPLPLPAK